MPHFKVDDAIHSHPKAIMAGDSAMGLWLRAGGFCTGYGTDGFVPDWWVKQQPQGKSKASRLVAVQLWHPGQYEGGRPEYQGQTGYNFHEWRQDSYEKVEADRKKWRDKKAAQRGMSQGDKARDTTRDTPGDSYGDSRESPGYIPNTQYPVVPNGTTKREPRQRGTRLQSDWKPPQGVIDAIRAECPHVDLAAEHRKFIDYWTAKAGQGGVKLDWSATWRNWIRRAAEQHTAVINAKAPNKVRGLAELAAKQRAEEQIELPDRHPQELT